MLTDAPGTMTLRARVLDWLGRIPAALMGADDAPRVWYDDVTFAVVRDVEGWTVRVDAVLAAAGRAAPALSFDATETPLRVTAIGVDGATRGESAVAAPRPRLRLADVGRTWHRARIRLELRWTPDTPVDAAAPVAAAARGRGVLAPCLVLPDMLPALVPTDADGVAGRPTTGAPRRLPRLFFADSLPPELGAGGVAVPDADGAPTPELLQTVIYRKPASVPDAARGEYGVDACGEAPDALSAEAVLAVEREAGVIRHFIGEELGFHAPVRPVVCVTDLPLARAADEAPGPTVYRTSGAYAPHAPPVVWAAPDSSRGKSVVVTTTLAQAWLGAMGGGVVLWGPDAAELTLGLGGALGLRWVEATHGADALARHLARCAEVVARAESSGAWGPSARAMAAQLWFYEGFRAARTRRAVGALLRSYWGRPLAQDVFVEALRRAGVRVPARL